LHDLVLEPLLALIVRALDRAAARLVTARHPTCYPHFWWVAPYVRVYRCEERIVCVFEGWRGEDLGEGVGELFLVQVPKEEEG
jgi:hypothetical protein